MLMKTFSPEQYDTQMLAKTALGEARGEGEEGMGAVMHTVMNRLNQLPQGSSISDVVLAPSQFSAWNAGNPNREFMEQVNLDENESLINMAERVISGEGEDPTGGATHYFAPGEIEAPGWAGKMEKTATVGGHEFFKEKKKRGRT
jgi:spore germination cell wall hydrolase CwlJ-like protein